MTRRRNIRVLVTGGPTRAYLDRVRYLTNYSTGALSYRLCRLLCRRGMDVFLVSGPTAQPFGKLRLAAFCPVETTEEMHAAVMALCRRYRPDVAVFSAAVLDFAPLIRAEGKVTSQGAWTLKLVPTPKIIDDVGKRFPKIKRIGFKLEWKRGGARPPERYAREVLEKKRLDALCLNYLSEIGKGEHPARLISKEGDMATAATKDEIARWIADYIRSIK